ncbi:MAG TPA: type II toxin-antitoxin system RelE/ParE family toxin [Verrucomicrobiae bacterium]|nr:type II toxin-antitoxin system RelE/ParE family toxin [Verrucomicrobiae bacterium]
MVWKIIFSPQAIADLEAAVRFIAKENPETAMHFGNELIDRVAILENFPLLGPSYPKRPAVRKLISRPYIIFYRVRESDNTIDILRYWHGAQRDPGAGTLG